MCFDLEQYAQRDQDEVLRETLRLLQDAVLSLTDITAQQACIQTLQHFVNSELALSADAVGYQRVGTEKAARNHLTLPFASFESH